MATRGPIRVDDSPANIGPLVEDFRAIEMLREHLRQTGWAADYRQIGPGQLQARLAARMTGNVGIVNMSVSQRVDGLCRSPDDMFTVTMSTGKNAVRVNGLAVDRQQLLITPPKIDANVTSQGDGWSVLSLLIPVDMLAKHLESHGDDYSLAEKDNIALLDVESAQLEPFRWALAGGLSRQNGAHIDAIDASLIVSQVSRLLLRQHSVKSAGDAYRRMEKQRIFARAREYVDEHLTELVRVTDLCTYCGVSLSTLERIFKSELGIGPNRYIQAARLHKVRRTLLDANSAGLTIADIAMTCGFAHMGRFSRRYRAHFGRLPSEERRLLARKR